MTLSGMSAWVTIPGNSPVPCVLINLRHGKGRQNFTILHEVGHLLRDPSSTACRLPGVPTSGERDPHESWCDKFAAELLLPKQWVGWPDFQRELGAMKPSYRPAFIAAVAHQAGCSIEALTWRLMDLGRVDRGWAIGFLKTKSRGRAKAGKTTSTDDVLGTRSSRILGAVRSGELSESYLEYILGSAFQRTDFARQASPTE